MGQQAVNELGTNGIFIVFHEIGECVVDVPEVVRQWNENWFISQWHHQYKLVHAVGVHDPEAHHIKAVITKECAGQLIVELDLIPEQSTIFRHGKTWRKQKYEKVSNTAG